MKSVGISMLTGSMMVLLCSFSGWRTDFEKAKTDAKAGNKLIVLKFSGSDWCLPCIRMEKEIFSSDTFTHYATAKLEMVNADFPRQKKNQQDKAIIKQNEALAERYNKEGHFPLTLLLDANGKVLKSWNGYEKEKPEDMISEIEAVYP